MAEDCGEFRPFITTWKTDNDGASNDNQITIPTEGGGYEYDVYWEDTTDSSINGTETGNTGDLTITFPSASTYRVEITGDFPRIFINDEGDKEKILTIEQWGDVAWNSMEDAFFGASNLTYNATDAPNLSLVTNLSSMFSVFPAGSSFNGDLSNWNVSTVTDMSAMFSGATTFNGNVGTWDVSSVTDMSFMFNNASSFNGDLSEWDVGKVTNMRNMFAGASSFNKDVSVWDVQSVTNMRRMFLSASSFNGDLSDWDVSSVESMYAMFAEASSFNSDLSDWDVSSVRSMVFLFSGASSFNEDLGNWDISGITNSNANVGMNSMFDNSGLSTENYDNTLIGWEAQSVQNDIELGAAGLTYCSGQAARQALIDDHNWTINDDALAESCGEFRPFITTWKTDKPGDSNDDQIEIPSLQSRGYEYDYDVYWEKIAAPLDKRNGNGQSR
ncbi:MAG: BspA family leucine-rich repeat surface protein [Balneolaceae bacterium]|nr:BspA family leucine-rich repeat surface protein [Balneolaceae bacterium]